VRFPDAGQREAVSDHVHRRVAQMQIDRHFRICGKKSGSNGATCNTPKEMGAASRTRPRSAADCASASSSAASPSAGIWAARPAQHNGVPFLVAGHDAARFLGLRSYMRAAVPPSVPIENARDTHHRIKLARWIETARGAIENF